MFVAVAKCVEKFTVNDAVVCGVLWELVKRALFASQLRNRTIWFTLKSACVVSEQNLSFLFF